MTTSPAANTSTPVVSLSSLLKRAVVDTDNKPLGRLEDAITRLRDDEYPLLTGLVIAQGGARVFVPANDILSIDPDRVLLRHGIVDLLEDEAIQNPFLREAIDDSKRSLYEAA